MIRCESVFQIVSCSRHDKNCYSLEDGGDAAGPSLKWTQHSSLTERLLNDRTYPGSVFVPNRGIFIFGNLPYPKGTPKSQFLPIGSKQWQEGIEYITLVCTIVQNFPEKGRSTVVQSIMNIKLIGIDHRLESLWA